MNLKQIEYFVSVAELGSFSKAARALNVAQPALSRQVRALETDLREPLLLRNGRGVTLTEAGQRLLDHGSGLLQQVAQIREEMGAKRGEPVGRITIALPPSMARQLTLPLIDSFRRELPKANLAVVEGLSADIAEWIATGRVDLGPLSNPRLSSVLFLAVSANKHLTPLGRETAARVVALVRQTVDAAKAPRASRVAHGCARLRVGSAQHSQHLVAMPS